MPTARSLLLLASPAEEDRAERLAAMLRPSWVVVRSDEKRNPHQRARGTDLIVHLDCTHAADYPAPGVPEVYAPCGLAAYETDAPDCFASYFEAEHTLARRARLVVTADPASCDMLRLMHGLPPERLRFIPDYLLGALLALALAPPATETAAALLLAFNEYPVHQLASGGAERVREVLRALGYPTVLLTLARRGGVRLLAANVVQLAIPKTPAQRQDERDCVLLAGYAPEDVLSAAHAPCNPALEAVTVAMAQLAGCAIFHQCYLAPMLTTLRETAPSLPVLYDSHNVEATLKAGLLADYPASGTIVAYVSELERRLTDTADAVLCCTEADAAYFAGRARRVLLLPHGAAPQPSGSPSTPARVGFLGSEHPPNVEAAAFIVERIAPHFPAVTFDIIGSVCDRLRTGDAPNVVLHGVVPEATKRALLSGWWIAINPMTKGGGASVKLADYLAQGVPVLSAPIGARGYDIAEAGAGWVVEAEEFPATLAQVLHRPDLRASAAHAAAAFGEKRSWPALAAPARQMVAELMARSTGTPAPPLPSAIRAWAETLPTACLPMLLGGACRNGMFVGHHFVVALPDGIHSLHLTTSTPQSIELSVHGLTGPARPVCRSEVGPEIRLDLSSLTSQPCVVEIASPGPVALELMSCWARTTETAIDLMTRHWNWSSLGGLTPGGPPGILSETEAVGLADAVSEAGGACDRALYAQRVPGSSFILVEAPPYLPLVRARARALAHAAGSEVVVADGFGAVLVPPSGSCCALADHTNPWRLLLSAHERCSRLILTTTGALAARCATIAWQLGVPTTAARGLPSMAQGPVEPGPFTTP
ncbi:MAG: glycosyltransferase [Rhodospirillales bacterium]|nr:glycosyltransferase [Rhodospirillales bacterium]